MTAQELNLQLNNQLKDVFGKVTESVNKYVDGRDSALKSELQEQILKELTQIEGLAENLEKLQELAEAFASVFDENEDGTVTADEIIAKISAIQAAIDKVAADVAANAEDIAGLKDALSEAVSKLENEISALKLSISANTDAIAQVKADLSTNYYTKDEVATVVEVKADEILNTVNGILFPDNEGDGAVV